MKILRIRKNSLATKIMFGFILTILFLCVIIFLFYQYDNVTYLKESYKNLAESSAKSVAHSLYDLPIERYLTKGKDDLYKKQFSLIKSICKNFHLKYIYVYVPDIENNVLTSIFYVDGLSDKNVKDRDLGTKISWKLTQQEKNVFNGQENIHMYLVNNKMGHTITSYAVIHNSKQEHIALVGADLDYDKIVDEVLHDTFRFLIFISLCLIIIYISYMTYLNKVFIKPLLKISKKMRSFASEKYEKFIPLDIKTNDEFSIMARSFNKMVIDIKRYMQKVSETQMETIFSLAKLAQSRDDDTGKHLERVQKYCYVLAKQLKKSSPYSNIVNDNFIENIVNASSLHDIGKVGISDLILLKPERHTQDEFEIMKKHTTIGYETLKEVNEKFGSNSFIEMGMLVALSHHERWDGMGYPNNLKGEEIPLCARIMAIADVYDALGTKRVYKPAFEQEKCISIIQEGKGTQFDPILVDAFMQITDEFYKIRCELAD